jgi:hypothetical protein
VQNEEIHYPNGDYYRGDVLFGMKHGFGKLTVKDGLIYIGNFEFDKKEGQGRIEKPDCKCQFFGEFKNDLRVGFGRNITCKGEVLDGIYSTGIIRTGTIYYVNGDIYEGEIKHFRPEGKGNIYYAKTNKTKKGIWRNGEKVEKKTNWGKTLSDPESEVMNSFRNGNSDLIGY